MVRLLVAACAIAGVVACRNENILIAKNVASAAARMSVTGNGNLFSGPCGPTTTQLVATVRDSNGVILTGVPLTYMSLTPTIATVSSSGLVTAVPGASGTAHIQITVQGRNDLVTVVDVLVSLCSSGGQMYFTPQNPTGTVGTSLPLNVTCTYTGCNPWMFSSQTSVVDVRFVNGYWTVYFIAPGSATICLQRSQTDSTNKYCGTATATQVNSGAVTITPSNPTFPTGAGCTLSMQFGIVQGVPVSWTSSNNGTGSIGSNGLLTTTSGMTGTITLTGTPAANSGYTAGTTTVTFVNSACTNPSVTVNPPTLSLQLGGTSGTLTATVQNSSASGSWSSLQGCVSISANGLTATVVPVSVCVDTVRYTLTTGQYGQSIVTVSTGATSCTWSTSNGVYSYTVGTSFTGNANCVYQGTVYQPYWYSHDPSRFTVLGAPYVCMIGGTPYPCGNTATIKAIAAGSTDVCVQAAVQDPTVFGCRTLTATTSSASPDLIPNDEQGVSFPLPTAPPKGAKVDRMMTWNEWKALRMEQMK